jgi:hypothetical protein
MPTLAGPGEIVAIEVKFGERPLTRKAWNRSFS